MNIKPVAHYALIPLYPLETFDEFTHKPAKKKRPLKKKTFSV